MCATIAAVSAALPRAAGTSQPEARFDTEPIPSSWPSRLGLPNALANRRAALWRVRVERPVSLNTAKNTKCTLSWSVTFLTNIL
jgi:hypothetical protein